MAMNRNEIEAEIEELEHREFVIEMKDYHDDDDREALRNIRSHIQELKRQLRGENA